jgi:hypothetical protein
MGFSKVKRLLLLIGAYGLLSLYSHAEKPSFNDREFLENIKSSFGCEDFRDLIWSNFYKHYEDIYNANYTESDLDRLLTIHDSDLRQSVSALVILLFAEAPRLLKLSDPHLILETLSAIELGDRSTPAKKMISQKAEFLILKIEGRVKDLGLECSRSSNKELLIPKGAQGNRTFNPQAGIQKVFSTFYQSCDVLDFPLLKESDSDVQGISIVGNHPDGVGKRRVIRSKEKVNATHFYIKKISTPSSPSCRDIRENPPIYNYGGKPHASHEVDSPLNFFKRSGSGSNTFGIDCAALVFSNLAAAGLKLKANSTLKAVNVYGVSSAMLRNPQTNGLDCIQKVTFTENEGLKVGDIISAPGHTTMVYAVGQDPFGVSGINKLSDCKSTNMLSNRFNFSIIQSAPIKNGLGVNQISINEYLKWDGNWRSGLIFYALKACRAKFGVLSSTPYPNGLSIVRHKGSAECLTAPLHLVAEDCVRTCHGLEASL